MITSLRLKDFKNFADETLRVGPFTLIVGANASGKSNIRDAFRFLHGIGRGYTLAEIVGGKYGGDWKPIRGSVARIVRLGASESPWKPGPFSLEARMQLGSQTAAAQGNDVRYRIEACPEAFSGGGLSVVAESLRIDSEEVIQGHLFGDRQMNLDRAQPALFQILHWGTDNVTFKKVRPVVDELQRARFFDFRPDRMREPTSPGQTALGDGGEHLPLVLQEICNDPERKSVLTRWIRELTPMDVKDFEFPTDPSGKVHLVIQERNGGRIPADSASDGTLRFLAMLAALLGNNPSDLYFFEEIENGLHPSRLHLLVEIIERQTANGGPQVIATTHSPDLLSIVSDETFENTSVTCRLEHANDAVIRRVADLRNVRKLRKSQGLGRLLAGGWMETALAFSEDNGDCGEQSE